MTNIMPTKLFMAYSMFKNKNKNIIKSVENIVFFPCVDKLPLLVFLRLCSLAHSLLLPLQLYFVQNICKLLKLLRMIHANVEISMTFKLSLVFGTLIPFLIDDAPLDRSWLTEFLDWFGHMKVELAVFRRNENLENVLVSPFLIIFLSKIWEEGGFSL